MEEEGETDTILHDPKILSLAPCSYWGHLRKETVEINNIKEWLKHKQDGYFQMEIL